MDISKWSLDYIRKENITWLEDNRGEWVSLLTSRLKFLLSGMSFIVITDESRSWFEHYLISKVNSNPNRPLLPFFSLNSIYPNFKSIKDFNLINDLLSLTFPNGFVYFYIGKGDCEIANLAKGYDNSFSLLVDEDAQNSFLVGIEKDIGSKAIDIRLIELFGFLDESINAILFNEAII